MPSTKNPPDNESVLDEWSEPPRITTDYHGRATMQQQ